MTHESIAPKLTDPESATLDRDGYCILKRVFSSAELTAMNEQISRILDGNVRIEGRRFQPENASDDYAPMSAATTDTSWRGNIPYRKVSAMEFDPVFLAAMQSDRIRAFLTSVLGPQISIVRATMFTKTPNIGGPLPWHQDMSLDWPLARQPELVMWYPIDSVGPDSGALEVVAGSHKFGIIGRGHLLPAELEPTYAPPERIAKLLPSEGDIVVFDAALLHRSGINTTTTARRALNVVLISGSAVHTQRNFTYPVLFGENAIAPDAVRTMTETSLH